MLVVVSDAAMQVCERYKNCAVYGIQNNLVNFIMPLQAFCGYIFEFNLYEGRAACANLCKI